MQNIENESNIKTKKTVNKSSRDKGKLFSVQIDNDYDRQEKIAILAYQRAEKRGFSGNEADALQDWLEAEKEVNN